MNNRNLALKMAIRRHIEHRLYLGYISGPIWQIYENFVLGMHNHYADMVYVTITAIFDNSTWRQPPC